MIKSLKFSLISLTIAVFVIAIFATASAADEERRYITDDDNLEKFKSRGCKLIKSDRVKSFNCQVNVAEGLGLKEDIKVFALDINADKQINADDVWSLGYTGMDRTVAVLDTGINYNHSELSDSYAGGKDFVNADNDPLDDNGHGTHVSGIITANGADANAKGAAPDAKILAGKVLDAVGSGYLSDVINAIYWAADSGADAISMSLGTGAPYLYTGSNCDPVYPEMTNAINYAISKNVAVVAASGNSGRAGVSLPGCISGAIAVGAVDSGDVRPSWSGAGNSLDIAAPGVNIYSTEISGYATYSGTSMATPHASAVVALLKQVNANLSVSAIKDALYKTAKDLGKGGWDKYYGWGRVDALGAVNFVLSPPQEPKMHVASIEMLKETGSKSRTRAIAAITVVDAQNNPVSGVTVYGHWSGLTSDSDKGATDSNGKVKLYSDWKRKASGTFTFTVNNLVKSGWVYDSAANVETSDNITI